MIAGFTACCELCLDKAAAKVAAAVYINNFTGWSDGFGGFVFAVVECFNAAEADGIVSAVDAEVFSVLFTENALAVLR